MERERGDVRALLQLLLRRAEPFLSPGRERFESSFRILQHGGRANELLIQLTPASTPVPAPVPIPVSIPVPIPISIPVSIPVSAPISAPTASISTATRTTRGIAGPRIRGAVRGHDSDRFLQLELGVCAAGRSGRVGAGRNRDSFEVMGRRMMIGWNCSSCLGERIASNCERIATVGAGEGVERSSKWPTKLD